MSDLAVQVSELTGDDDRFVSYKQAVFAYLSDFMARFDEILPAVQTLVASLHPAMPMLLEVAARADVAPTLAGSDEGPLAALRQRWAGVVGWFLDQRAGVPAGTLIPRRAGPSGPAGLVNSSSATSRRSSSTGTSRPRGRAPCVRPIRGSGRRCAGLGRPAVLQGRASERWTPGAPGGSW